MSSYVAQAYDASDPDVKVSAMQAALSAYELVLPSQTGNSGKYLTTNGTAKSWATIDLSTKQDAAAFLTTLVGIGGTSGSGNLARATSPTFVTPTLGSATASSVDVVGNALAQNFYIRSGGAGIFGFLNGTQLFSPANGTLRVRDSSSVIGTLDIANVTASGTVTGGLASTPGTFAVVNATTATATLGLRRITDRSNRLAYPDGTNWRFVSDDAIIS